MSVMANADINRVLTETVPVTQEKPDRVMLVELKNGKLVFKQKPMSFEKMSETMQEIVKFREMLEQRIESNSPALTVIPDEHKPLIAKFIHESDKGLQALSRHIQQELLPAQDEDDEEARKIITQALPLDVIEKTVKTLGSRQNYGLDSSISGGKVPAAWQVWRWEVKEEFRGWLPKTSQEKAQARFLERQQARKDVCVLFQALSESEQQSVVGTKSLGRTIIAHGKEKADLTIADSVQTVSGANGAVHGMLSPPKTATVAEIEGDPQEEDDSFPAKKGPGRPRKTVGTEKVVKDKEREAMKLARAEREKKEKDAQDKSRNLFVSFFKKPKASGSGSKQTSRPKDSTTNAVRTSSPSVQISDFEKTFRPFTVKKDAELAPINWFQERRIGNVTREKGKESIIHRVEGNVIVIEDDEEREQQRDGDVEMEDLATSYLDLGQLTAEERLQEVLTSMPRSHLPHPSYVRPHPEFKSYHPTPVRTILSQLNEAEIAGDDEAVRRLLALLRNRTSIPAKVLIFTEDARPGYFGTWTRNSREVGPRTPFTRDVVAIDYGYDSGEEWEEESGEADDVLQEDEEDDGEEPDSDLESWLVDDDDADPGTPIEERADSPDFFDFPPPPPKRKTDDAEVKATKKRKVVVPLVPFTKGPCWENVIGRCGYEPFNGYRIHLFNDTPFPINPFTFVSAPLEERPAHAAPSHIHPSANAGFAVPALPVHVAVALGQTTPGPSSAVPSAFTSARKSAVPPPKTVFPEQHIPLLLSRITSLETGNLTFIVETVYKELREFKVKKNAIEAKVRELGEKSKEGRKVWVIRQEAKGSYDMT